LIDSYQGVEKRMICVYSKKQAVVFFRNLLYDFTVKTKFAMKIISLFCQLNLKKCLILCISTFFLESCDCLQKVEGKVIDAQSMKVLTDVAIYKQSESYHSIKTDTSGVFKFSDIDGGRNCSEVALVFEKTGYKSDTIVFSANTSDAVVKLSR
jgi:hypothetical protein